MLIKLTVSSLCAIMLWLQARHPELGIHAGVVGFVTNMLWLWG